MYSAEDDENGKLNERGEEGAAKETAKCKRQGRKVNGTSVGLVALYPER